MSCGESEKILGEHLLTMTQATKKLPTRPHATTIWRWARYGHRGIFLEYVRCGRVCLTSEQAIRRFALAVAALDRKEREERAENIVPLKRPKTRAETRKDADIAAAYAELQGAGILPKPPQQAVGGH